MSPALLAPEEDCVTKHGGLGSIQGHIRVKACPMQVNAEPHMGSAYSTIAADVLARYQRLRGRRVVFVTGTDEHGEKIAEAAARKKQLPQEHCNSVAAAFKDLWERVSCQRVHPVPQRLCKDLHR